MLRTLRNSLNALAAIATLAFVATGQAHVVGNTYDPTYFDGIAHFWVPDFPSPCLTQPTGFNFVNGVSDPCQGVVLIDASVTYNDGTTSASLFLPPPTPASDAVFGMVLDPTSQSIVVGFDTNLIPLSVAPGCTGPLCGDSWFIEWSSGLVPEEYYSYDYSYDDWGPLDGLDNQVFLFYSGDNCDSDFCQAGASASNVAFTPEPESLALLLAALGAGWVTRRRRASR